jgi:MFS family permease
VTPAPRPTSAGPPGLLRQRDFRLLWGGDLVSQWGSEITLFALPLVMVATLQASGTQIGLLVAMYTLPFFVLPLFVGVWQEQRSRRPVMISMDLLRCLLVLSVPLAAMAGLLSLVQLYVIALLVGSTSVVYDIAAKSYLPRLVAAEQLASANSKLTVNQAVSATAGPGFGGWIVGVFGAVNTLFLDSASYLVSALALIRLRHREPPAESVAERNLRHELRDGLRAVFSNPPIRAIALHAAIYNSGGEMIGVAFVVYYVRDLGMGSVSFGFVMVLGGLGAIAGALGVPKLIERIGYGPALLVALAFGTVAYFLVPAAAGSPASVFWLISLGFFLGFAGSGAGSVIAVTVRQRLTPPELLARMNATYRLMNFGTIPVGAVLAGVLVDGIGARTTLWLAPFLLLASVVPVVSRSIVGLRRL